MGYPIWLVCIVTNTVYDQFQKQQFWAADNNAELYGIRLDARDIFITTQWYEHTPRISGSHMVYILYVDNPPQVQSHTQLVHGKILMTQTSVIDYRHTSARNKSPSP